MISLQAICALVLAFSCLSTAHKRQPLARSPVPYQEGHGEGWRPFWWLPTIPWLCSGLIAEIHKLNEKCTNGEQELEKQKAENKKLKEKWTNGEQEVENLRKEKDALELKLEKETHELEKKIVRMVEIMNLIIKQCGDDKKLLGKVSHTFLGAENQKLKEKCTNGGPRNPELEKLKKERKVLEQKLSICEDEVNDKATHWERLDHTKGTTGATSALTYFEPTMGFADDPYDLWTSKGEAPQMIWIKLPKATRVRRFSFQSSMSPSNGATKYQFVASNDTVCHDDAKAKWDVLLDDQSGIPFNSGQETKSRIVFPKTAYKCYGFKVLDVAAQRGKFVMMAHIKMWTKD